jgi:hypothetical protein
MLSVRYCPFEEGVKTPLPTVAAFWLARKQVGCPM